jgi:hypothetical protein
MAKQKNEQTETQEEQPKQKPLIERIDWKASQYEGRKVYTTKGTGHILAEGKLDGQTYFKVKHGDGEHAFRETTTRFNAVDDSYRDKYAKDNAVKTESGAASVSCGDNVAEALKGLNLAQLASVAQENGLTDKWEGWSHLNPGMRRMNLGNKLRMMVNKDGATISVLGKSIDDAVADRQYEAEQARKEKEAKEAEKAKQAEAKKAEKKQKKNVDKAA